MCLLGNFPALAGVDLSVAVGETVLIKGPNGAGKTTLLRCLAGLTPIHKGTARILGHDLESGRGAICRDVAILSQANHLYSDLSADDNLALYIRASRVTTNKTDSACEQMGISSRVRSTKVRHLSTGQKRRVAIACLLVRQARLWLLDEPHSGLDWTGAGLLNEQLVDQSQAGTTIVIVSHDLERVGTIAGRTLTMVGGTLGEDSRVP